MLFVCFCWTTGCLPSYIYCNICLLNHYSKSSINNMMPVYEIFQLIGHSHVCHTYKIPVSNSRFKKRKKKVNVSSFSCAVTVTCHSDCVRAFVAVKYQWQCVGKCLFVSVYRFWLVVAALVSLWKPVIKTCGSEHVRSLCGYTASLSSRCMCTKWSQA